MWILSLISIAFPCSGDAAEQIEYLPLQEGISSEELCDEHSNFYIFELLQYHILYLDILFSHVQGDIDVYLYDANTMELLRSSTSSSDNELITYRAFEDISLLVEIQTHPSVLSSTEDTISYVMQTNFVVGTCEDNWDLWNSTQELPENTESESSSEVDDSEPIENIDDSNEGPPLWKYSRNEAEAFSFSLEEPLETEMFFDEQICMFSEHWYHFQGNIGEEIDFQVIYPKTIHGDSSLRTDGSLEEAIVHEDPFLQMYLYDTNGQLLRIATTEEENDNYRGIVSYDFLSYSEISNVYLQLTIDDIGSNIEYEGVSIPYELRLTRQFFEICLEDDFVGNSTIEQAVAISSGSYTLQACQDDFFYVYLEGNYDIRLEHEVVDGELDLIVYDELFDEISRSSNDSGEDVLSVQADGDTYIHVSLREDFEMEGVPYVLSYLLFFVK